MTEQRQAELIGAACKEVGLDGHIHWIYRRKQADTWAEKIAMRFKGNNAIPVKTALCTAIRWICAFSTMRPEHIL